MRTTLNIADDVLQAARERARRENKTVGEVVSELARAALGGPAESSRSEPTRSVFGFRPFPKRGGVVTNELIDRLRQGGEY
ncbi:MAG: antitoxin [Betaproteobacteria bacterium]|nr:antitoxin [Betaproteobacteria bacterium]PWB58495.1 MAG: antitoxin [Betaproteobacteria bacterium]